MKTTELKADFKPLKRVISQALLLIESPRTPPKLSMSVFKLILQSLFEGDCFSNHLCSIKCVTTRGTGELWLVFNPSKRLSELVATLRATKFETRIARKRRFGHCLAP
jgi:hypothetical protein